MLPLLLLLVASQAPAVPGETSLVSFCKQGRTSACESLEQVNPKLAAELRAELAKTALRLTTQKSSECTGQTHHIISNPIFNALKGHKTLRGLYAPRDKRFEARAKDKYSHCGYQQWPRDVDKEVIAWLKDRPEAPPDQFIRMLRELYNRPARRERFPNGF
jgi:hypothetical protein